MVEARIERLIASIGRDLEILARLAARLEGARSRAPWDEDDPILYLVGVSLDHYYSAFEAMAERVMRAFEGPVDRSERWHRELLDAASLNVRGARPALVTEQTASALRTLLEFRHFMRHAYGVPLDPERLSELAALVATVDPHLRRDVAAFIAALRA